MNRFKTVLGGIKSYLPFLGSYKGTGGTKSATYCYSVWLRHLILAYENGLDSFPATIAELGPGDSIGMGIAGLLSGAKKYYALDIVEHTEIEQNLKVFEELVELFKNRSKIPGPEKYPGVSPQLDSYEFPSKVLTKERLKKSINLRKIEQIRNSISKNDGIEANTTVSYICPWISEDIIEENSVDMIFSQAVLEHVDDLDLTYRALYKWLKRGGVMTNRIDFKSHGITKEWNGHWGYSDLLWKVARGKRPFFINRSLLSTHLEKHIQTGFSIEYVAKDKNYEGIHREDLAKRFKHISEEDLTTTGAFIIAKKK